MLQLPCFIIVYICIDVMSAWNHLLTHSIIWWLFLCCYTETPKIVVPLSPAVHRENQGSVTFTCRARGTPAPTISWFLNERNITQLDDSRFREHSSTAEAITTGQLTVTELQAADSGIIKCVAATSVQTMSGVRRFDNSSQATLSVLSKDG